ncbi:MAG: branched-chain amino acid transaminase [Gemmatimonadaceae bacterium]|nr:branched-chain amino acid transaminase [Gemmatimonadaceae bacterium]
MTEPRHRIWRDGQFVNWEDATIHVMSHVVHYGSSVFEGIRCYATSDGPAIFRLPEHMRRFADSCRIYRMPLEYSVEDLTRACVDTVAENNLPHCYLRPLGMRGGQQMGIVPSNAPLEVYIIPWTWGRYLGNDALHEGVDVCVSSWRRAAPDTFPTMAKAGGNYLNSQLSVMEAKQNGYAEGIMLDSFGFISEGTGENVFLVQNGKLLTPALSSGILHGITRDSIVTIARDLGIEVVEGQLPREMLYTSDEAFFTGTAVEVTPIRSVDRIPVGSGKPGPITLAIQKRYLDITCGKAPDTWGWLTHVPAKTAAAV